MPANNSCQVANTPPVTPRENSRTRRSVAVLSPSDGVFTPAKLDDVSRASSLRIPVTKHRSPLLTFRQPVLNERAVTTPPYAKRRKSTCSESSGADEDCEFVPLETEERFSAIESRYRTPPRHGSNRSPVAPGAPRKGVRKHSISEAEDNESLRATIRLFEDPNDVSVSHDPPDIDWDSYLSMPSSGSSRSIHYFNKGVRAICTSGLEAVGKVPIGSVREVLKCELNEKSEQVLRMLRSGACSDWISFSSDEMVEFPQRITPAELISRIPN